MGTLILVPKIAWAGAVAVTQAGNQPRFLAKVIGKARLCGICEPQFLDRHLALQILVNAIVHDRHRSHLIMATAVVTQLVERHLGVSDTQGYHRHIGRRATQLKPYLHAGDCRHQQHHRNPDQPEHGRSPVCLSVMGY
jgi:hypothetical protein